MKSPHNVIQLSRLQAPVIGKGRPYTVDFGIAKPLYKQLISSWEHALHSNRLFILGAVSLLYISVLLSFFPNNHITYADPILASQPPALPMLTMPAIATQSPVDRLYATLMPFGTYANDFSPGNCTQGVASRLPVSWSGNANQWADNAQAQGIPISGTPKVGSIAQTSGDSYLGHVAIVTAISPDGSFTVWEENGPGGLGVTDERVTNTSEFPTFIYI